MQVLAFGQTQELMNRNVIKNIQSESEIGGSSKRSETIRDNPHNQRNLKIFKECQDSAQCIIWWINRALAFIKQAGLSPTLIHHEPLGLPKRFQEKVDLLLNSEEYWSMDTSDD